MIEYIMKTTEEKTKLTTSNIPKIIEYNLAPVGLNSYIELFKFRKLVFKKDRLIEKINKTNGLYMIPESLSKVYFDNYHKTFEDAFETSSTGVMCLNSKNEPPGIVLVV